MPVRPVAPAPAVLCLLTACASSGPPACPPDPVAVTVTDDAIQPGAVLTVPHWATVVWQNRGTRPIAIEVPGLPCSGCDTVLGFATVDGGARAATLAPQQFASLCFHQLGRFPFTVRDGVTERTGAVIVEAR